MTYKEYQKIIKNNSYSEGLEYTYAVLWLHPERLPLGVVSMGSCEDTIVKIPREAVNAHGKTVPVIAISGSLFKGNKNVTDIILHSNIRKIPQGAFSGCTNLKRVTIPKSVKSIGEGTFAGCESLTDVYFEGTVEEWEKIDFHNKRYEVEFGNLIPGTPIQEIIGQSYIHVPGNDALFTCNVHFRCDLGPEAFNPLTITAKGKDVTELFRRI